MAFHWWRYTSDDGFLYAVKVEDVYAAMPERGWAERALVTDTQYARGWRPRQVFGVTPTGRIIRATCGSTDATLWTGETAALTYIDGSGQLAGAEVIGRLAERVLRIRAE